MFNRKTVPLLMLLAALWLTTGQAQAKSNVQYINVSAATLWKQPQLIRQIDNPALAKPANLRKWTNVMSYQQKLALVGRLETQALYGSAVTVLEEKGSWAKVAVHNQPSPLNQNGYPGWVPKKQLAKGRSYQKQLNRPFALITSPTAWLYKDQKQQKKYIEISFDTRLPVIREDQEALLVATPSDGNVWLSKQNASVYKNEQAIPTPSGKNIVQSGKQFLGLPYLWSGMSGFGYDCSGFAYSMYHAHGIVIPRDSSVQARLGKPVAKKNLQAGDLVFFAHNKGKGNVHHVGIYIGAGKMIHSPNTASTVRIDHIDRSGYGKEYAGARRYTN